jgi:2-dehydropantoate 2-reductase
MLEQTLNEIYRIARALNIDIREDSVERAMHYIDNLAANGTTSLQRDIIEGRPSELEYQTGTIVRLSKQVGIDAPLNTFIYHALLPGEMKARGTLQY